MLKTIVNRKKRLCARLRSEDEHHLRKSLDRKAQISPVSGTNAFLIVLCDLQIFSGGVYPPSATSRTISFFYLQYFLVLIRFILSMKRRTVQPEIRSFVSVPRSPVKPFDRGKTKSANFTKNRNCFEECNVFGNGKCELSAI